MCNAQPPHHGPTLCGLNGNSRAIGTSQGELSAYSVYNPDGERLAGELTAASLDRQIRGGGTDTDVRAAELRAGVLNSTSGQRLGTGGSSSQSAQGSEADLEAEEER